jgi:glycosyltransferase involved in cell wall biosynthesis
MSRRPRIAIVGTVGLPPRYGGFETLAHFLVWHLHDSFDFTVYCSGPSYSRHEKSYLGARLRYLPFSANGVQSIPFDIVSIADALLHEDVVLVLGVSGGAVLPLTRLRRTRTILNIGGLDWQRSKWGGWASRYLKVSESMAVRSARVLVADNEGIAAYLSREYGRESVLIEYGGDQITLPRVTAEHLQRYSFLGQAYCFSVARIQPDNNIEMILSAFAQSPEHTLAMVGNWSASGFGRELKAQYGSCENLHLLDAIYDQDELNVLRGHCSIYVHGHSAGGTNPSLVEAMHLGLPILAFDVIYNRSTTEGAAEYFGSAAELAGRLRSVPAAEWNCQRSRMKSIADRRYCWSRIAAKYAEIFSM